MLASHLNRWFIEKGVNMRMTINCISYLLSLFILIYAKGEKIN